MTKFCSKCNRDLPISQFSKKSGETLQSRCKDCFKAYVAVHYIKNKDKYKAKAHKFNKVYIARNLEYINNYKSSRGCLRCQEKDAIALDLHHLDPKTKDGDVSNLARNSISISSLNKELEKCVVICSNCHRKFHAGRFELK